MTGDGDEDRSLFEDEMIIFSQFVWDCPFYNGEYEDEPGLDVEALRREMQGEELRWFGLDNFRLEHAGEVYVGDIDIAELVGGLYAEDRPRAAARLLRLLQAPPAERGAAAEVMMTALLKNLHIRDVVEQVAGSERKDVFASMYEDLFATEMESEDDDMFSALTTFPTPALHAYMQRLRAGMDGEPYTHE